MDLNCRSLKLAVALLLIGVTAWAQPESPAAKLDVSEHVLDNGLKVLVVNRPGVPVVSSYVWYKVGSMDEAPGVTGIAHFLEHMMFKGSRDYKVGDVDRVTVRNGGSNNAFTSNDFTGYYIDLPKSRWREAMKIEADRMQHLTLDLAEFDSEKKVVQSESDIAADDPSQRMWQQMSLAMFGRAHPYGHPVLGWPQDVADTTRRDMRLFYEGHYHPNHATLVLVGDITADEAMPVVRELFGPIRRGPELNRPKPAEVDFKGPATVHVKGESEVTEFARMYLTPPVDHPDTVALDLLGAILGRGVTSRLYRALVDESRVAMGIGSGHSGSMLSGSMYLWGTLAPGRAQSELTEGIQGVIDRVLADGLTPDEIERAKNRFVASSVFERERASDVASALGLAETIEGDWRQALSYPDRIRAVTAEDLMRVARQWLRTENAVTGWVVPEIPTVETAREDDARAAPLPVKRHVLSNGLTLLLLPRAGAQVVSIQADVRNWRAAETAADCGLAGFTGALLDAGTQRFSKQQLAEWIQGVGGELSTGSSGASLRILSEHVEVGLDALVEVLRHPTFPEAEVELARGQYLAALEAAKNETASFSRNAAAAVVYGPNHPLGRPSDGTPETLAAFDRARVAAWHATWFRPDNCVIAVVGDFKEAEMLARLEAKFADWQRPQTPLKLPSPEFQPPAERSGTQVFHFGSFKPEQVGHASKRVLVDHPGKDQVAVRLSGPGIRRDDPDYFKLVVMDAILGTSPGFTDRFSNTLRDQMGLAYSTFANISRSAGPFHGSFVGYIGTRPENVETALAVMYRLIEQIRTEPVSDDELRAAKDYLKGSFVFSVETTGDLAGLLVSIERNQLGWDYLVRYTGAIEAVTPEDIMAAAKRHLVPARMAEVIVGPIAKIAPPEGE